MSPPEMPVEQFERGAVIALTGELDAFDAPGLRKTFEQALAHAPAVIVLDLSSVTFLDSTVLGAIVGLLRRQREAGRTLRVVLPESTARRVFEITGLDSALDIASSRDDALAG